VRFDTTALTAMLDTKKIVDADTAILDAADLYSYAQTTLASTGLDIRPKLCEWLVALPATSPLWATLMGSVGIKNLYVGASTAGASVDDIYIGNSLDNRFDGQDGNDTIYAGAGNDYLSGGNGTDTLAGGTGNDNLYGGYGNDTYLFNQGDGADTIGEYDYNTGNVDVARFGSGVSIDQLWFSKAGNNLEVSIIGTTDKLTLNSWYSGNQYHVEQFKTADGKTLLDSQVQNLVSAMAAFAPPAAGQTTLTANYATTLNTVIAANWQ
jgi:Ca2+-binding RTX toxin-like protein